MLVPTVNIRYSRIPLHLVPDICEYLGQLSITDSDRIFPYIQRYIGNRFRRGRECMKNIMPVACFRV